MGIGILSVEQITAICGPTMTRNDKIGLTSESYARWHE